MPITTRQGLIDYCRTKLGEPIVTLNIDNQQVEDRIDEALSYFYEYHDDAIERIYMKHLVTGSHLKLTTPTAANFEFGETVVGQTSNAKLVVFDAFEPDKIRTRELIGTFVPGETVVGQKSGATGIIAASNGIFIGDTQNKYIPVSDAVTSILRVIPLFAGGKYNSMFDVNYQLRLNDLYNVSSMSMIYYTVVQQHLSLIDFTLNTHHSVRFNRLQNKVHVDLNWDKDVEPGTTMIFEVYAILDPQQYGRIYDNIFLKKYATALIQEQWGMVLKRYTGLELPGGVQLNGQQIYDEAVAQRKELEDQMQEYYTVPPMMIVG